MRHRHVVGIAAIAVDAEQSGLQAHVLSPARQHALAAAKPGIDQRDVADFEIAFVAGLPSGPNANDFADALVAHGPRQRYAAILQ